MKDRIIECMAKHGWQKDRIVDVFSKMYETAADPVKKAGIWLKFDQEGNRWWLHNGDFTSAGENVLAGCFAIFQVGMLPDEIERMVDALVAEMDRKIAGAFSVRLLRYNKPENQEAS